MSWMSCFPFASTLHLIELVLHLLCSKVPLFALPAFVWDCGSNLGPVPTYRSYSLSAWVTCHDSSYARSAWNSVCSVCVELWTSTKAWPLRCSTVANGWSLGWSPGPGRNDVTTLYRAQLHIVLSCHYVTCTSRHQTNSISDVQCAYEVKMVEIWHSSVETCWNSWRLPELQSRLHQLLGLQRSELGESSSACFKTEQHTAEIYKWNPHLDHGRRGANRSN